MVTLMVLLGLAALCSAPPADDVYLKNGRVLRNVETQEQEDRLLVMRDGMTMAFPLNLVERIVEKEVVAGAPRTAAPPPGDPTSAGAAATPAAASGVVRTNYEPGEILPKRVRLNNGIDVVTFDLPDGMWTWAGAGSSKRATGQDDDPFGHMNPANVMVGWEGGVAYKLSFWPFLYSPDTGLDEDWLAENWLSFARTELREGPMKTRSAAREHRRRIGAGTYLTTTYHHLWEDSNYQQDGIFLLLFPRDYDREGRFYVLQWFVTYPAEFGAMDLDMAGFEMVVRTFNARRVR